MRPGTRTPELSASELWMAFSRDPAGSDGRFRDHPLQVTGTIRSVHRDSKVTPWLA